MIHVLSSHCPQNHNLLVVAYDDCNTSPEHARAGLQQLIAGAVEAGAIYPWCAICRDKRIVFEDHLTEWHSMEEAQPLIEQLESIEAKVRNAARMASQN